MIGVVIGLFKTVGLNLFSMLLGPKMIIWTLRLASKASDNDVDDNIVDLVEAAYEKDTVKVKSSASKLMASFRKKKKEDAASGVG